MLELGHNRQSLIERKISVHPRRPACRRHSKRCRDRLASAAPAASNHTSGGRVLAPAPTRQDRMPMHNANKLKIGLFGANCSSGRAVTLVPERWSGSWPDNLELARM